MKITTKTRIRVRRSIAKEFNLSVCDRWSIIGIITEKFDLRFTSKRGSVFFFEPRNEQKLALFLLQYSEYLAPKFL